MVITTKDNFFTLQLQEKMQFNNTHHKKFRTRAVAGIYDKSFNTVWIIKLSTKMIPKC